MLNRLKLLYWVLQHGAGPPPSGQQYVAEDGLSAYVTEDGASNYVTE